MGSFREGDSDCVAGPAVRRHPARRKVPCKGGQLQRESGTNI